ncbi:MAG: transcriptional repressor NrdR [Alphaproteobacteria bacterium]|nr:transcriptional repressor NrdR [Alphaproteobacteria bacterium]
MRCPFCGSNDSQVKDSRPSDDGSAIRRRRFCPNCAARFTTFERVELREFQVMKRSGQVERFERDKLLRSMTVALRKRPFDLPRLEQMVNGIVRQLESLGESVIASDMIGEKVMDCLKALDKVAYVRYASVYKDFNEARDFESFIDELRTNPTSPTPKRSLLED